MSARAAGECNGTGGLRLFTQSWLPERHPRAVVVIVHGLGEHSDRYDAVAQRLVDAGYAVWACDHRGHGRSQGPRELVVIDDAVADLDVFLDVVTAAHPGLDVVLLGHSFGGLIAVRYALAHGARPAGLVLSGTLAAVDVGRGLRTIGRLVARLAPRTPLIALDSALVSRDPAVVAAYEADPLVHHGRIPAFTAAQIADAVDVLPSAVGAITLPTLVVYGTADGLCPPRGSVMLGERIGSADVTIRAYEGLYHEVLNEPERETVLADVLGWLDTHVGQAAGPARA